MHFYHAFVPGVKNRCQYDPLDLGFLILFRLRSGPFEGPAIVKPPALPGDSYFSQMDNLTVSNVVSL
jgi:hypothetical protein